MPLIHSINRYLGKGVEGQISDIDVLSFPAPIDTLGSLSSLYPYIINIRDNLKSRHLQADMVAVMCQERNIPMHGSSSYPSVTRLKAAAILLTMGADFRPHFCQFIIVGDDEKSAQQVDNLPFASRTMRRS